MEPHLRPADQRAFHPRVASYFIKDDHDTCTKTSGRPDDAFMGELTCAQGLAVFREQVPMGKTTARSAGGRPPDVAGRGPGFPQPQHLPTAPTKPSGARSKKRGSSTPSEPRTLRSAS